MNQSVIPRYYEKAARGGNTDALLYLLKFYGLGYIEYGGIGASGANTDEQRFREICKLKLEKFADYKVPDELPQLASQVDTTCKEIVNIKAQEEADKEAHRVAVAKQKEEHKRRMAEELAQEKADQEERRVEEQGQKEEQERRLAEEKKLKETEKRQEQQLIEQKKAKEEILTDTKIKYPKADLFKSKINFYKNFEAGISYQWAVATLEKDGISFTIGKPSAFYGTSLKFKDDNNEVTLAFASETDGQENPEAILAMALIVLPLSVPHEAALKKYRDRYPDAEIKRDTEKKTVKNEPTMLNNGMILIPDYAWLLTIDHIVSEHVKCDIISQTLVGKNFYANNIVSPKSLLFELLPDGSYKKGANLSHELEQAVPGSVAALKEISDQLGAVKIVLTDLAIEKVFSDFKKNADADARKNAEDEKRKKDAAALNF